MDQNCKPKHKVAGSAPRMLRRLGRRHAKSVGKRPLWVKAWVGRHLLWNLDHNALESKIELSRLGGLPLRQRNDDALTSWNRRER